MWINPVLCLRVFQALFAIVALALGAHVANWYNSTDSTLAGPIPSQLIFLIFTSVWTVMVAIPYTTITPRYFPTLAHKFVMLSMELVTAIFWLGGFAATADFLRKLAICRGEVCSTARASVVFGAFEFVLFGGTSLFAIWHVFNIGQRNVSNGRQMSNDKSEFGRHRGTELV